MECAFDRVENVVRIGENAGYQHFLLSPQCFQKGFYLRVVNILDCVVKGKTFTMPLRVLTTLDEEFWKHFGKKDLRNSYCHHFLIFPIILYSFKMNLNFLVTAIFVVSKLKFCLLVKGFWTLVFLKKR